MASLALWVGISIADARPSWAAPAQTAQLDGLLGRTVSAIEVQGLKRIEPDAVRAKVTTKVGEALTADKASADVQAIFGMGYFEDIAVLGESAGGNQVRVIYQVRERPVISKLEYEGNERISTSDLEEVVKIKQWSILDINKVKEDVARIQKHYEEKGFYLAKVSYSIEQIKPDEVGLTFKINDYDKVQIKKITFLNNKRFSDEELKSVFRETREGGPLSFVTGSGNFKESSFKQDLQILTYWYLDHGYVKFRHENPVVTISDDKKWLYVSIYVDEGEQYEMGQVDFGGDLLFEKEALRDELVLLPGDKFSISERNADIQKLTEKYQDLGYAFTNVIPKMAIKDDTKTVDIQYDFEKGNLVYFGEINIIGNTKTYDKVIRRELKIKEGELYSGSKLRESRENVERLGYFAPGEVVFNTLTPKGKPDVLNVEISIKERSTGTVTLGAGYASVNGFFLTTQVSEINLFGRGQTLSLSLQLGANKDNRSLNLGFTDPYAFDTLWSTGFDIFYVTYPIPNKYVTRKTGFDLRLGRPVFEYTNAYVTYKFERLDITDRVRGAGLSEDIDADEGLLSSVVWSTVRDKRNNRFETTDGNYQSASLETAGLGGDKKFVKWVLNNRFYKRLLGDLVFRHSAELGQIHGLGDRITPPSERFYLGGPNSLKGFQPFSVGPSREVQILADDGTFLRTQQEPLGGLVELYALFELEYPLIREAGLKFVTFFDAGNAYARFPGSGGEPFTIRTDAGFGFRWFSPMGPLRFEFGYPLKRRPGEDGMVFQFFIGPPF